MDAEVNSTLAVFFFRLGQRRKDTRFQGTNDAGVIHGRAIEFVGSEGELDVIHVVVAPQSFEEGATEAGVTRGKSRKGRSEIRAGKIARLSAQGTKGRIAGGSCIPIPSAGGTGARVRFP